MAVSSVIASQASIFLCPNPFLPSTPLKPHQNLTFPKSVHIPRKTRSLNLKKSRVSASPNSYRKFRISASYSPPITPIIKPNKPIFKPKPKSSDEVSSLLTGPTRTITSFFALAQLVIKIFADKFSGKLAEFQLRQGIMYTAEGLMFAALSATKSGRVNTPITVIAAGMAKWLEIYSGVLLVRTLLSWFPTLPWDKQPFMAIRDLSDPYLNLFRGVIPPIMNTLDVSPLFAFSVLGGLASLLKSSG